MAVKDGQVAALMCSYNDVRAAPAMDATHQACENRYLLTTVLRDLWGFTGYVQSGPQACTLLTCRSSYL